MKKKRCLPIFRIKHQNLNLDMINVIRATISKSISKFVPEKIEYLRRLKATGYSEFSNTNSILIDLFHDIYQDLLEKFDPMEVYTIVGDSYKVTNKNDIIIFLTGLKKEGTVNYFENQKFQIFGKERYLGFTYHSLERLIQRYCEGSISVPRMGLQGLFRNPIFHEVKFRNGQDAILIYSEAKNWIKTDEYERFLNRVGCEKDDFLKLGYLPIAELNDNFACFTTFLIPGMWGTPEWVAVKNMEQENSKLYKKTQKFLGGKYSPEMNSTLTTYLHRKGFQQVFSLDEMKQLVP